MSYERRMLDANYDEVMGNKYNKCEYCYDTIINKEFSLEDGFRIFCSNKCRQLWKKDESIEKIYQTNPERFKL